MNPFAYGTVILIWGTTPLGVQWSAEGLSPFAGALLRMLIALTCLLAILKSFSIPLPFHKQARKVYSISILGQGIAMLMVYWSSTYLPSSLVSLIFGFSPLITGLLAWFLYAERLSVLQVLAILLGVAGLMITISPQLSGELSAHYELAYFEALVCMFVACILFSLGNIWLKRFSDDLDIHPFALATGNLIFALPLYLACVWVDGFSIEEIVFTQKSAGAILYLAIFGSVLAPYCFFSVLRQGSANLVALITVVAPVIAIILGATLNDEVIGLPVVFGALLVLSSLLLYQYAGLLPRALKANVKVETEPL